MLPVSASSQPLSRALIFIILSGCIISSITFGMRSAFGFFTLPVSSHHMWDREIFSLAIALQNLFWGLGQPLAGVVVDKYGPARVVAFGGIIFAIGLGLMSVVSTPYGLYLTIGVMIGLGTSCASFNVILAAFSRILPASRRAWALGVGTAAGSSGQFIFAPLGQGFIAQYGWMNATLLLAAGVLIVPILAISFSQKNIAKNTVKQVQLNADGQDKADDMGAIDANSMGVLNALRHAFQHKSYILLIIGFFVCGFQLAFITVHFPPYLEEGGIDKSVAGWAIGLIGLANVIGAYYAGILSGRFSKAYVLSWIYFLRGVSVLLFILLPLSNFSTLAFSIAMGLLWLSTVPPTSGLVISMFGTKYMATLYGFVFLNHQIGSFLGVWLGGYLYDITGTYNLIWYIGAILSFMAAIIHLPIREKMATGFRHT